MTRFVAITLIAALVACGQNAEVPLPTQTAAVPAKTEAQLAEDDLVARRCAAGIAEKMPYLEPDGEYYDVSKGLKPGERAVLVDVRLADSFRAGPVGVVKCEVDTATRYVHVTKVRQ